MILDSRIVDDVEHLRVVFASNADVKEWAEHVTRTGDSYRYIPQTWDPHLFSKPREEILEFIDDRFRETTDVQEYYACMLFLRNTISEDELYVLWKDSSNFKALQAKQSEQIDQGHTNIAPKKVEPLTMGKMNRLDMKQTGKRNFNTLKKSTIRRL
jgi:hypothetical protein